MSKQYDAAVVIGRFQIPHAGHLEVFNRAYELADRLIILVGSVGQPATPKNPFTFTEREQMLKEVLVGTCDILPIRDQRYNIQNWVVDAVNKVNSTFRGWTDKPPRIALVGHHKDESSYYLDMFPQWKFFEVDNAESISSTDIRNGLFEGRMPSEFPYLTYGVKQFLSDWVRTQKFADLVKEYKFIKEYRAQWSASPYAPTFNTVDAVVIQSGHILMVRRKHAPGKGLWALPGGFIGANETLRQSVIRELVEETRIHLQPKILDRNIVKVKTFDAPDRSQRGRTITQAFLITLEGSNLPRVYGSDDAEKAQWFPLNEIYSMGEMIYEDHLDIILNMTGDL